MFCFIFVRLCHVYSTDSISFWWHFDKNEKTKRGIRPKSWCVIPCEMYRCKKDLIINEPGFTRKRRHTVSSCHRVGGKHAWWIVRGHVFFFVPYDFFFVRSLKIFLVFFVFNYSVSLWKELNWIWESSPFRAVTLAKRIKRRTTI